MDSTGAGATADVDNGSRFLRKILAGISQEVEKEVRVWPEEHGIRLRGREGGMDVVQLRWTGAILYVWQIEIGKPILGLEAILALDRDYYRRF